MVTKISTPALSTDALERVKQINACAAVQAGISAAIVDVLMAMYASVARITDASAAAASALTAAWSTFAAAARLPIVQYTELRIIQGRLRAISTLPLCWTVTVIVGLRIETWCRIATWIRTAMIAIDFALVASEAHRTHAFVSVH